MPSAFCDTQQAFDFIDASSRGIWRVWRDSFKKWLLVPLPRKTLRAYYREAQRYNMATRGALGGSAMRVLHEMIEHYCDDITGECTPSKQQLATRLGLCVRTVANALDRLRAFGLLDWVRRCIDDRDEHGRFQLKQISNAYSIKSPASWKGYRADKVPAQPKAAAAPAPSPAPSRPWRPQPIMTAAEMVAHYQANPSRLAKLLDGK
jgi:hypothetical protein